MDKMPSNFAFHFPGPRLLDPETTSWYEVYKISTRSVAETDAGDADSFSVSFRQSRSCGQNYNHFKAESPAPHRKGTQHY